MLSKLMLHHMYLKACGGERCTYWCLIHVLSCMLSVYLNLYF